MSVLPRALQVRVSTDGQPQIRAINRIHLLFAGFSFPPLAFEVPPWLPSKRGGGYTSSESPRVLYAMLPCKILMAGDQTDGAA